MGISGSKLNAPISIGDLRTLLSNSSYYLGTLCTSVTVNPYAKYKPVPYASYSARKGDTTYLYRGSDNKCGLDLVKLTFGNITLANVQSSAKYWRLTTGARPTAGMPTGGASSPYRMLDFDGYDHAATCPLQFIYPTILYRNDKTNNLSANGLFSANFQTAANSAGAATITPWDLMQYLTLTDTTKKDTTTMGYIGVLMFVNYGTYKKVGLISVNKNSSTTPPAIDFTVEDYISALGISSTSITAGMDVYVAPCLCNISTGGVWKDADSYYNQLQVLLLPAENSEGAIKKFVLQTYRPVVTPSLRVDWTISGLGNPDASGVYTIPLRASGGSFTVTVRVVVLKPEEFAGSGAVTARVPYPSEMHEKWSFTDNRRVESTRTAVWTPASTSGVTTGTTSDGKSYIQKTVTYNFSDFRTGSISGSSTGLPVLIDLTFTDKNGNAYDATKVQASQFALLKLTW